MDSSNFECEKSFILKSLSYLFSITQPIVHNFLDFSISDQLILEFIQYAAIIIHFHVKSDQTRN